MLLTGVLGDQLAAMLSAASQDVVLVSPFIKLGAIQRLLANARAGVAGTVITRWRPEEVAAGVTDLEVMDEVSARHGWTLLLSNHLHAKYYRFDTAVVVGSANLTAAALAWRSPSNVEILFREEFPGEQFRTFERELRAAAVPATPTIRATVLDAASSLPYRPASWSAESRASYPTRRNDFEVVPPDDWLPRSRNPADVAYAATHGPDQLSSAASDQVLFDLAWLDLPMGIGKEAAERLVRARLAQHPLVAAITAMCSQPQRFGAVSDAVASWLAARDMTRDPDEAWQTLMRWLLHFAPDRYTVEVARHSELFRSL